MNIKPLKNEIQQYLNNHQLIKNFEKAKTLFEQDEHHPSLNVEVLEPNLLI